LGTIRKRESGKWQVRVTSPQGKQISIGTYRTKTDAQRAEREYENQYSGGTHAENLAKYQAMEEAKTKSFREVADRYLRIRSLAVTTRKTYQDYLEKYLGEFADTPVRMITQKQIEDWWAGSIAKTLKQRQNVYMFAKAVFNYALELEYISRNPCRIKGATGQVTRKKKLTPPTIEQVKGIIDQTEWGGERLVYLIAYTAGLRKSELLELRLKDLELDSSLGKYRVRVERAVGWLRGGETYIHTPKAGSKGEVLLPSYLTEEVKLLVLELGTDNPEALLWAKDKTMNTHLGLHDLNRRFDKYRKRVGYSGTFHDARAFANSQYNATGATQAEMKDRLRQTTLKANEYYQRNLGRESELIEKFPRII
jgi:integrase